MADLLSRPVKIIGNPGTLEQEDLIKIEDFLQGLIADADAARIPTNALAVATNATFCRAQVMRRNGLTEYSITKPNSTQINRTFAFYHDGTGITILRITKNTIHRAGSAGWTEYTPSGIAAFGGSDADPFFCTVGDNRLFVSNNGYDPIREVDPTTATYFALGNAPQYKYITTAFNRVIGAALVDPVGGDVAYQIGWSGDRNYDEWDPLVDLSAGSSPLVDSPSDVNDDLTGLFSYSNILIAPRIKTCWIGIGQPSATKPFNFYAALPDTGADIPRAIQLTNYGLAFYNYLESAAYVWLPTVGSNSRAENITTYKVARALKNSITDPNYVWASYSKDIRKYSIFVADPNTSTVKEWGFNFEYKTWEYAEFELGVSSVNDLDFASSSVTIDELTGDIDSLVGTIQSLSGLVSISTRFFGFQNGDLKFQGDYYGTTDEVDNIVLTDDGEEFTTTLAFKILEAPVEYLFCNLVRATVTPRSTGTVNLEYSKDDGQTWTTAKSVTFVSADLNKANIVQIKKAIRTKRIQWRLTTTDCMCSVTGFYAKGTKGGVTND